VLTPVRSPDSSHEILARLIEILAPGERDIVAVLECYFDESGSHDGSPVLCVAGFLYEKERCKDLDLAWKDALDRFRLPYFHMVDCAHGSPPFKELSREERIAVETQMIGLIRSHATFGVAVALVESEYNELFPPPSPLKDAYSYSCWLALSGIYGWIMRNQFDGKIAYFFEAGHKYQSEANALMAHIFNEPNLRQEYRYAGHSFIAKEQARPIQTADILAWQHATDCKKILNKQRRRADYSALIEQQPWELRFIKREHLLVARSQLSAVQRGHQLITGMFGSQHFASAT
jgi:hypothetical protein